MINIILRGLFYITFSTVAYFIAMPVVFEIGFNLPFWETATPEQLVYRDNYYGIFLILPAVWISLIGFWMYTSVNRKTGQVYEV